LERLEKLQLLTQQGFEYWLESFPSNSFPLTPNPNLISNNSDNPIPTGADVPNISNNNTVSNNNPNSSDPQVHRESENQNINNDESEALILPVDGNQLKQIQPVNREEQLQFLTGVMQFQKEVSEYLEGTVDQTMKNEPESKPSSKDSTNAIKEWLAKLDKDQLSKLAAGETIEANVGFTVDPVLLQFLAWQQLQKLK